MQAQRRDGAHLAGKHPIIVPFWQLSFPFHWEFDDFTGLRSGSVIDVNAARTEPKPAKTFDIKVNQLAGMVALVSAHGLGRLQIAQPRKTGPAQNPANCGGDTPGLAAICVPVRRSRRNSNQLGLDRMDNLLKAHS